MGLMFWEVKQKWLCPGHVQLSLIITMNRSLAGLDDGLNSRATSPSQRIVIV